MAFGSFVAGATTEGGGAIAFPVFTKLLHIPSGLARDFALAIQSVGMTCGALLIARSGYPFLGRVYAWTFSGAAISVMIGLKWLAPAIPAPYPKIFFTFFTVCFGFFLYGRLRTTIVLAQEVPIDTWPQRARFFLVGLIGGLVSSLVGSGADVVLFVVLCLRYQIDEKIGTRTTVFLMASVSMVGFSYQMLSGNLAPGLFERWLCAVPIVAFGAPLGAWFCSFQRREGVIGFLLFLISLELVTTLWLIPFDGNAVLFSVLLCIACLSAMALLARRGTQPRAGFARPSAIDVPEPARIP